MIQLPIDWDRLGPWLRADRIREVLIVGSLREAERLSDRAEAIVVAHPPPGWRVVEGGRS